MNAPNRFELYTLGDNEKLLEVQEDTKIPNAATFRVAKQDHTLANMMRSQLLKLPATLFAGYKVPHPLEPYFVLKVQTDGTITPQDALQQACVQLIATVSEVQAAFEREFELKEGDATYAPMGEDGMGPRAGDYLDFGGV